MLTAIWNASRAKADPLPMIAKLLKGRQSSSPVGILLSSLLLPFLCSMLFEI